MKTEPNRDFMVDKARITASFVITKTGRVEETKTPTYIDTDKNGVLKAVFK